MNSFCFAMLIAISCAQPRLDFETFYEQACGTKYPGYYLEDASIVHRRLLEGVAAYVDYAEKYWDQCHGTLR